MSQQKMREALSLVREALQLANDTPNGGITDTIWMPHTPQTLFDFIDEALAQPAAGVELTDEEIMGVATKTKSAEPGRDGYILPFAFARAVIAAHIEKQNGGGV